MYTFTYTYKSICNQTFANTYTNMHTHTITHKNAQSHMPWQRRCQSFGRENTHVYAHAHTHIHKHPPAHMQTQTQTHTRMTWRIRR